MTTLTAIIYPDDESDWFVAYNPETGTTTQGKTTEEALANLKEATELYLSEFTKPKRTMLTTFDIDLSNFPSAASSCNSPSSVPLKWNSALTAAFT